MQASRTPLIWRIIVVLSILLSLASLAGPAVLVSLAAPATSVMLHATYDWLQYNGDPQHTGNNVSELALGQSNAASLARVFRVALPGVADGAPVFLSGVATPTGTHDLLFLTTQNDYLVALDGRNGNVVWIRQSSAAHCGISNGSALCYVTLSPAIDPNRQYVYTYGPDSRVHKYHVTDGAEVAGDGWPAPLASNPADAKRLSSLTVATIGSTGYLYVTEGGYPGNVANYQGRVPAIDLSNGAPHVFGVDCRGEQSGNVDPDGRAFACLLAPEGEPARQGGLEPVGGDTIDLLPMLRGYEMLSAPAIWTNPATSRTWVFVATRTGIAALESVFDASGRPSLQPRWEHAAGAASSPLVANDVLYYASGKTIYALRPADGVELWHDTGLGGIHRQSPMVANGRLYIADAVGQLTAYAPVEPIRPEYLPLITHGRKRF
jgi:outer membrane protein assembly factor BamB